MEVKGEGEQHGLPLPVKLIAVIVVSTVLVNLVFILTLVTAFGSMSTSEASVEATVATLCFGTSSEDEETVKTSTSATDGGLGENQRKVAQAYADAGYSRAATAGVMGNLQGESHFDPKLGSYNGDGGYGIAQWTPRSKIRAWFDANGLQDKDDSDLDGQIKMLIGTAQSQFADQPDWPLVNNIEKKSSAYETWVTAKDTKTAAIAYMAGWERPAWASRNEDFRVEWAKKYYDLIGSISFKTPDGQAPDGSAGGGNSSGGSSDDSDEEDDTATAGCQTDDKEERINDYIEWALKTAKDEKVGYSMDHAKRTLSPDVDCSSFVYYALAKGAKFDLVASLFPFNTTNEGEQLQKWGFEKVGGKETKIERGDILLNPGEGANGHTEIALNDKRSVGGHGDNGHPEDGDQDGHEVSEEKIWTGYTEVWRYPGKDDEQDGGGDATFGAVGGAPTNRHDYGWMCDTALKICKNGDFGRPNISWGGDYQCYWYWLARSYILHDGDIQNPMTGWGGQLAAEVGTRPGWTRSDNPKPGAGVSFILASQGINHVAVVEKVEADPSGWKMMISEGNWADGGRGTWNGYNTRWLTKSEYQAAGGQGFFWKTSWKGM